MKTAFAPYRRVELDLARPLPAVELASEEGGIAAILRYGPAFVGFAMRTRSELPNATLDPQTMIDRSVREAIETEMLRQRLAKDDGRSKSLCVAICTKDGAARVTRLLDSLLPLREETPFEVLVIDNAPSDDSTRNVVLARSDVNYIREPLIGLNFARNRALREVRGDILAFLDDDVTVDAGWARTMRAVWADNPDAGAVTGLVLPLEVRFEAQVLFEEAGGFRRGFVPLRYGATRSADPVYPAGAGIFGAGANMSVDVELVRALGGFDDALDTGRPLPGGGDLDIFYRIVRAGRPLVYEPQAAVFHEHRRDMAALAKQYYTWGLGFMAFLAKSWRSDPGARPALCRMGLWWFGWMARRLIRSWIGREPVPSRMVLGELWGGLRGLAGEYSRSLRRVTRIRIGDRG